MVKIQIRIIWTQARSLSDRRDESLALARGSLSLRSTLHSLPAVCRPACVPLQPNKNVAIDLNLERLIFNLEHLILKNSTLAFQELHKPSLFFEAYIM